MPTQIARLGRERTIGTLTKRVYRTEDADSEALDRAGSALLAANPRLSTKEGFRSGAAIVVPQVPGLPVSEAVLAADIGGGGIGDEAALRIEALGSRIEDAFQRGAETRAEALERMSDRAFTQKARKALPESAKVFAEATERLTKQSEEAEADRNRLTQAVDRAVEGWRALEQLVRRSGTR